MRKSFTWLSSLIVLMLLSFQMALAAPQLATNGLSPSDGGKIDPNNAEFTLTFKGDVMPTEGQIIGLYSSSTTQPENKAIQLRAVDKSTDGSVITYTHPDGTVTFNGKVVTIVFNDVDWSTVPTYWVTIGSSAIKDATGNFNVATEFDGGDLTDKWDFTVKDLVPPTWSQLDPKDNAIEVAVDKTFSIKFNEDVKFVGATPYVQQLEDFAIYTSTDWDNVVNEQEGGDLVSTYAPTLKFYDNGTQVYPKNVTGVAFDSISINWVADLPGNTDLYVRIKKDMLQDLEGNKFAGMNDEDLWNITTKDDDFAKPTITAETTPLRPNDTFLVDFDDAEVLYIASSGAKISNDQDLKAYIKVTDKNGDPVVIKTAKIATATNTITVVLNANMVSSLAPYTVATTAGDFKDASGNPSKPNSEEFDAGNWDAPTVVADSTTNYSGTSFDFLITTNEPATVHYIVVKKGTALVPTINEIAGFNTDGDSYKDVATAADLYYNITASTVTTPAITPSLFLAEGNLDRYYGKQTATDKFTIVEVFAAGTVNVPQGNFEVLKRIDNLPDTHGQEYVVYYFLADNATGDIDDLTAFWYDDQELLSGVNNIDGETVDILMPEAWFDGDSVVVAPKVLGDVKLNKDQVVPPTAGTLTRLSKNGKIYINFNEPVRKFDGTAVTATDLKNSLFVYEGDASAFDKNADTPWSTNVDYSVSISPDKKQITITPAFAWSSSASVWVKIRNSKIEDEVGNEIVPYGAHYAQEFEVEDYVAPLVRYTFGNIFTPMDSMINVPYQNYVDGEYVAAPITVTVSEHIYVFPGAFIDGHEVTLADGLIPFTSDSLDDQYIGRFFKIRSGTEDMVNENTSDPLELTHFEYDIQFVGDSTVITITPTKPYESELWYLVQIDERIHDRNLQTIAQGALVDVDADRPTMFKLANALTGNATETGWLRADATTDDNQTMVFKSDDSRNPKLFFFTKQQSILLSDLEELDGKTNISLTDTIGVYIDEYVSLGFDHYFFFDSLTSNYVLDANAMRRYFKVYDENDVMMQFDVVELDTTALLNDSLIFFIDPYYVDSTGVALSDTESSNFKAGTTYTVFFNSEDTDDMGIEEMSGKAKGIYWDDNKNLILETKAVFSTPATTPDYCVEAVVSPVPGATGLNPDAISFIDIQFNYAAEGTLPTLEFTESISGVTTTVSGQLYSGNSNIVRFPVEFFSNLTYTIAIGDTVGGQITINSGIDAADTWPAEACNAKNDSVWTYTMLDATAPELDTAFVAGFTYFTIPADDSIGFDKTSDIVMVFDEEVKLVPNKRLTIYDSSNKTVVYVLAQNCQYGKNPDKTDNKHVIVVPSGLFASALEFSTNYHIIVDHGFVTDFSPIANQFAGVLTEDLVPNGVALEDLDNDWSFQTGADPAPYFVKFSPANGTTAVQNFSIEFSEPVNAAGASSDRITVYEVDTLSGSTIFTQIDQFRPTNTAKITPNANKKVWTINIAALETAIEYGKQYAVTVDANAFEDSEDQPLDVACTLGSIVFVEDITIPVTDQTDEATATWYVNFRDDVAPSVVNVWPRNGAEHVPYNAYLYIEFNEPVALSDGSAIIPDPNLINQTIKNFISITSDNGALAASEFQVEFVGNNKKLLRITPFDVDGHNYDGTEGNPSMDTYINYTVSITNYDGTYYIVDGELNQMASSTSFSFLTEDITAPEWVTGYPTYNSITCDDVVEFGLNITEASDTALVYYAIVPAGATKPSAADLFAQTVSGAIAKGVKGVDAGASTLSVDLGALNIDFDNDEAFELYAVVSDLEVDIWKPSSSAWDSLFMFDPAKGYGEGYDRIRDIMPAPNKNFTVVPEVRTDSLTFFRVTDDDAPEMVASYPEAAELEFPIGDSIHFWFSEAVTAGIALPNSITLRRYDNNIAVDATVNWVAADSSFYITPANDLDQETKYYVEFDRYAIEDAFGVCSTGHVYYPQMVGRGFWFETEDNIGPRLYKVDPEENETCVSCPDLNEDGDEYLSIYFYDANDVVIANNASDPYIYLYRANESVINAWDVIPASLITIDEGSNDTTWVAKVPLHHVYYPNDLIKVVVPAGLFADVYGNVATVSGSVQNKEWFYTTCNTEAPAVTWSIHNLSAHFNYSETPGGIEAEWEVDYMTGNKGAVVNDVPTHVALKVDFGEEVEFNTTGTTWKALGDLTNTELMAILKVSGLTYNATTPAVSDIDKIIVDGNTVTLTFKYGTNAKLPSYQLLEDAYVIDGDGLGFLDDYYEASLESETEYKVTVTANKVRAANNCVDNSSPRYVESDIVTLNTRDDKAPTVSFENLEGESLCENDAVCIDALEEINIVFNKPVVKSSYDVRWLDEESYTWDNLPLNEDDLEATGADDFGQYIEFYPVVKGGTVTAPVWTIDGPAVAVNVVALDDENKQRYVIQPEDSLTSEGWYMIKFNKHTVKNYEGNDPSGTVFEGDSCFFFVGDYIAPDWTSLTPGIANTSVGSDTKELSVLFNEQIAKGTGIAKLRREDGTVFAEFDVNSANVVWKNKTATNVDTLVFKVDGLEEFTKYYVEMPKGYVVDDNTVCTANEFEGFAARLDASTGELLDADWWFQTSDATPPQLISIDMEQEEMDPLALFPLVGDTVSMYSNLEIIFDENIEIISDANTGIVIYHDNGNDPSVNFGNAIEFIPWSNYYVPGSKITLTGTDKYNGLVANKLIIDPETIFDSKGTYYVRVNGEKIEDGTGNKWSDSEITPINPVRDREWYFTIANDVAPVLVYTTPAYDGVNAAGTYELLDATDYAYVETDLVMEFYDNTIANDGKPLNVARGDELRMLRIFEYTYDAEAAEFMSKPWIEMPITDESIEFDGNKVIIHNVMLKDGIRNMDGVSKGVVNDSCYYVTVDPGAVLNGFEDSQTWWPGISNGFRWRFTTGSDVVFVDGYEILSPNIVEDEDAARNLTIEEAGTLIVQFNEGVGAIAGTTKAVKVYDVNTTELVETVTVTDEMCEGNILSVPLANIYDEATFYVVIEEGAFGDTATVQNENFEIGGLDVWTFHTGDNTPPNPVAVTPADGEKCVEANPMLVLEYNESMGIIANGGTITVSDAEGTQLAQIAVTDDMIVEGTDSDWMIAVQIEALPDTSVITVTLSEGMLIDGDEHSPLASTEYVWSFTTGYNTLPAAELVSPVLAESADTVVVVEFAEVAIPVNTVATLRVQGEEEGVEITFATEDSLVYSAAVTELASDATYEVVFAAGAFENVNIIGCDPAASEEIILTFEVADIAAPDAEYFYPEYGDYTDVKLMMVFDDDVTRETGNVYVYDAVEDTLVLTIPVGDLTEGEGNTYTYTTSDLYYGEFYVLIDAGTFVDNTATPLAVEYAGIDSPETWPFAIVDRVFEDCYKIIAPLRNAVNIPVNTTIEISFCDERIAPPVREGRYVTVADQSEERIEGVNVFTFFVADSMIANNTLTIEVEGLKENTTYSIIVAQGAVTDEAGNEFGGINDANEWFFTTGDGTGPEVSVDAVTINNVDGTVAITSSEVGMVFLAPAGMETADALLAAVANGTAASAPVYVAGTPVNVSAAGLAAGTYNAYGIDANGNLAVAVNVVTVEDVAVVPVYTIAEIQGTGAASPYAGEVVKTTGVVTAVNVDGEGFFIQDANAARSGIYVYDPEGIAQVTIGTGVTIVGEVSEYFDLTELTVQSVEYVAPVVTVKPIKIAANQVGEDYEGVYVRVEMLKTTATPDENDEWMTQTDEGVEVKIDNQLYFYNPDMGQRYHVEGVVNYTWSEYKIAPTVEEDVEIVTGLQALDINIEVYPNPFNDYVAFRVAGQVEISKAVITNIAGQLIKEVINPDNTISTTELRSGVYFISLHTEDGIAKTERIIKR